MSRVVRIALSVMLAWVMLPTFSARAAQQVTIILWRGTPSEQAAVTGLLEGLREQGLTEADLSVTTAVAEGVTEQSQALVTKAVGENPSALVCVGTTPATQAAAATELVPIVFLDVFDPVQAQIIGDWASSGNNVVGASSHVSVQRRMEYAESVFPAARRWAVVSSRDPEAVQQVAEVAALAAEMGLDVKVAQGTTAAELERLVRELAKDADLVFTVQDGLVESAMPRLVAAAAGKPVIGASEGALTGGAVAGLGVDYHLLGRQASQILVQVLGGAAPTSLPSETPAKVDFIINLTAARSAGLNIPLEVLGAADRVIE
ncbi:MAG: ABC transporter substrate-binding protein [Betaproteobacteria bacterium]